MVGVSGGPGPTLGPNDQAFYAGRGSAVLNNGPENAILRDPVTNTFVQIAYGGASIVTPGVAGAFSTFPAGAARVGSGENFGSFTPGQSIQRAPDGSNVFNNSGTPTASTSNVCFAKGTRIATPAGPIPVETLCIGDLILLEDGTTAPVICIGQKHFSADDLQGQPLLWPVHLAVDALGANIPSAPLRLSRQHRLCVTGSIAQRMTGSDKVLLAAHCLLGLPGITTQFPETGIDYFHVLLPDHAIVMAEGTPAESLYLGPEAQRALSEIAMDELALIFPDKPWLDGAPTPVYPLLSPRRALRLVARHRQNKLPLIAPPQTAPPRDGRAVPKRG